MSEYRRRDHYALGEYYIRHVRAMTVEGLHSKPDIACELAWRDAEIERLRAALGECIELAVEGWDYASDYFRSKWCGDRITKMRRALERDEKYGGQTNEH